MVKYGIFVNLLLLTFTITNGQSSEHFFKDLAATKLISTGNADHAFFNCRKSMLTVKTVAANNIKASRFSNSYKISGKSTSSLSENSEQNRSYEKCRNTERTGDAVDNEIVVAGVDSDQVTDPVIIKTLIFYEENKVPLLASSNQINFQKKDDLANLKTHLLAWFNQYILASKFIKIEKKMEVSSKLPSTLQQAHYEKWWPAILLLLLFTANLYGLCRFRSQQLSKVTALRAKISQDLHDNVGAALSSISMFCHAAIQKNDMGDITASKQILERIGETSRDIMKDLNESVWLINPINDNLQKIIQRINNYALPLCTTKDIYFEVSATESVQNLDLSVEKRKAIYLFLKEAINNCLKYAAAKNLCIQFVKNRKTLYVSIKDDGIGFRADNSFSGNGLNNMKQRSIDINGAIEVKSMIQRGTEIQFQVPLNNVG